MKQNENSKSWLDEIRDEMLDFQAEIPANGWERVSSALPSRNTHTAAPLRWWGVAASVLLCVGLGIGLLVHNDPTQKTIADVTPTVNKLETTVEHLSEPSFMVQQENATFTERTSVASNKVERKLTVAEPAQVVSTDEFHSTDTVMLVAEVPASTVSIEQHDAIDSVALPKPVSEDYNPLLAVAYTEQGKSNRNGWIFGANIGGNGSVSTSDYANYSGFHDMSADFLYPGNFLFGYHTSNADKVLDSRHHTSWSFGLSVGKEVIPRLSLESGVAYTLLSSEVRMSHSGWQAQKIHYLGIPLRLNYAFLTTKAFRIYAGGGGMLEHSLHATRGGAALDVAPWQISTNLSIGGQYNLTRKLSFYIEPGVSWYFNSDKEIPTLRTESPVYFNLTGGVRFSYK